MMCPTEELVAHSPGMQQVLERVRRLADAPLPVLITGPTGAGKEVVARALHAASARGERAFVAVNCGALAPSLVERELFGHVRGAFTGADEDRAGVFEAADGGTLFLDEIGELPLDLQPRLLRVLETLNVRRVGSTEERSVDVRVVTATHRDLRAMVAAGTFREDLYHRLAVLGLDLPPLRDRPEDIAPLARRFLRTGPGPTAQLEDDALARLVRHRWTGNVRELRNVILRARYLCSDGVITAADLELPDAPQAPAVDAALSELTLCEEKQVILSVLAACGNNRARAARRLGMSRSTLHERLKRFGVPPRFAPRPMEVLA